ncbi:MAG: aminopeptidase [Actinomycetota bacterium]|nr:aminopeptidase [Actinomycetota bacterium]
MPAENLTRAEAQSRAAIVHDVSYGVELDVSTTGATFTSRTVVTFECSEPGATTWLDLIAPAVRSVTLNGTVLDPTEVFVDSRITLTNLAARNEVIVLADCAYMTSGEGLHRFLDPVDGGTYLYTQFEVADCRRVMAVFEQPDLKAPLQLTVTAPDDWQVVSNRPTPDPEPAGEGVARWRFTPTAPLASYLYALIAGDYYIVRDVYDGATQSIPLALLCRRSIADSLDADEIFDITRAGFAYYEQAFDYPYPFGKYDQAFVPEFNSGAMENPGAVTFHEDHYLFRSRVTDAAYEMRAETILHEMAHMWFGDLVTMTWWDDLWLNESFAEWAAHHTCSVATRFTTAWANFSSQRKAWAYRQDQLPSTHPIAADMVDLDTVYRNFDGITYAKGASALRQLVAWVGEDNFLAGLRTYFARHAYGNTQLDDLLTALSDASGRDLESWARSWLGTSGVNLIRPDVEIDAAGRYRRVVLTQAPPSSPEGVAPTLRQHRLRLGLYDNVAGQLVRRDVLELDIHGPATEVPELVGVRQPDLLLVNDDDLTYAKIRLDARSLATAIQSVGTIPDPLSRALIWGAAWDMTRDAELPAADFVQLVAAGIGTESDVGVVGQVLRQAQAAVNLFATPAHRVAYTDLLAAALRRDLDRAAAGSDHQLAYLRGFISFARTDADAAFLRALLDGHVTLAGLAVDTDVRWALVTRLVALNAAGQDVVEAQLALDDTAAGRRRARAATAARPEFGAKDAAWTEALCDEDLPNALLESVISGIMQPDQGDLVVPFIERYFETLPTIATNRTAEIGQLIMTGLYPGMVVAQSTIDRTDAFLATHPDLPGGARRTLVEGRDGVARALRCIELDGR